MSEIKCPECGKFFKIDESAYTNILKQVHDKEFEISLERKLKDLDEKKNLSFEIEKNKLKTNIKKNFKRLRGLI